MRRRPAVPWRLTALALSLIALTAAVAVAAVALAATPRTPACPPTDKKALKSTRAGADQMLVPGAPRTLLLCRYSGTNSRAVGVDRLLSSRYVTSARTVSRLAGELNALPPATGAYACPNDNGSAIIARFRYAKGGSDPVTVGLSGCEVVTNGHLHAIGDGKPVINQLAKLAPLPATLKGVVRVCSHSGCHVGAYTNCTAAGCTTTDRVAAVDARGRQVAVEPVRRGRFTMLLPAGRYTIELLQDGPSTHGNVFERVHVRARSGYRITATFTVNVP